MRQPLRLAAAALCSLVALTFAAALASAQGRDREEPKNLKVLPKTISRPELEDVMRNFSMALGVRCDACHAQAKNAERPGELDFASDEKEMKETARKMMKMVGSINEQVGQMGLKDAPKVACVTCHHGVKEPETLAAVLNRAADKGGVAAVSEQYKKLREQYYGSAAYDFSPMSLNEVARHLSESKKDFDAAIQVLQLNLSYTPNDVNTNLSLGRVQMAKGDKAAAQASFEKVLSLDANNRWAKRMLEQLKSGQ